MACSIDKPAQRSMGIGKLGDRNLSIKRKNRWTFTIIPYCGIGIGLAKSIIGPNFIKTASRPNFEIEEIELNYMNAKTWIQGKLSWQTITVSYIDAGAKEIAALYKWIGQSAALNDPINFWQGSNFNDYAAEAILTMYDGCGNAMEAWQLSNVWPTSVNFGELDQSSSEEAMIELTLRYDKVCYQGFCPTVDFESCCSPCNPVA